MQYLLLSKKTKQLQKDQIIQICKLKNTHYKYGFKSNFDWFKKNVKTGDIHNLIYYNSKLIGYTLLRVRTFIFGKIKKKYLYFDTLVINKKYRNYKISYFLMNFNNQIILKKKKISFLICLNEMVKYYQKFGWEIMKKKLILIKDHKFETNGMCFNNKNVNKKKKYIFYFYK